MEKEFIYVGSSVDEALKKGLEDLNLAEDKVKIEVLEAGSGGFFGLFKKEAKVRLTPLAEDFVKETIKKTVPLPKVSAAVSEKKESKNSAKKEVNNELKEPSKKEKSEKVVLEENVEKKVENVPVKKAKREDFIVKNKDSIKDYIENIVIAMGYADAKVEFREDGNRHYTLDIKTDEPTSLIIGKRGITLNSLQFLANNFAKRFTSHYFRIEVDCDNYRENRKKTLEELALNLAKKSKKTGRPVELEPMTSVERKIIHNALTGIKNVETESRGEEPHRYLVITAK